MNLPDTIDDVAALEELLSRPTEAAVDALRQIQGDILVLGVGGKMGPTLARMARRAADEAGGPPRRIIGVARFSSGSLQEELGAVGVETIRCDLLDRDALARLPDAPNVIYMAARKFGSTGQASLTWAMNCLLPGLVFYKYRRSRIAAFSTGNVYPLTPADGGGARESDPLGPIGEYAMSALGRERIYEHMSGQYGIPLAILRLNYAHELRYSVTVDIARQIQQGRPIDVTMGYYNALWQGDANAMTLAALAHAASPPFVVNLVGPETLSVRRVASAIARQMGLPVAFRGSAAPDALLSNAERCLQTFGRPTVSADQIIRWTSDWTRRGGATLDKPTHFEVRDGKY